jgi:hypothetical protein
MQKALCFLLFLRSSTMACRPIRRAGFYRFRGSKGPSAESDGRLLWPAAACSTRRWEPMPPARAPFACRCCVAGGAKPHCGGRRPPTSDCRGRAEPATQQPDRANPQTGRHLRRRGADAGNPAEGTRRMDLHGRSCRHERGHLDARFFLRVFLDLAASIR